MTENLLIKNCIYHLQFDFESQEKDIVDYANFILNYFESDDPGIYNMTNDNFQCSIKIGGIYILFEYENVKIDIFSNEYIDVSDIFINDEFNPRNLKLQCFINCSFQT